MKPEEKVNQQVWEILQDIKEEILAGEKGQNVKYHIPNVVGAGIIPEKRRISILHRLQEEKAFTIQRNSRGQRIGTSDIYYLIIDPLKFDAVYEKYQKACDLNSYLKDYQQKLYEGTKKISKLYQVEQEEELVKRQKSEQALRPINFTPRSNLPVNPSADEIFNSFSPQNYPFVLMVIKSIISLTDFSTDGKINYQLQSPQGQSLMNERALLSKLSTKGLFKNFGEDGIFGIATLGNLNIKVLRKLESYLSNPLEQSKTKSLEKPSDLIENTNKRYDKSLADALRKVPEQQREEDKLVERVTAKVRQNGEKDASNDLKKPILPTGWDLKETDNIPQILKDDDVVFTFPNNWSQQYRYYKCLWENYGKKKTYKEVYEFQSNLNYPDKRITNINRNIRSTINKLRKKFENENLPIKIYTNKGYTLSIS